MTKPRNSTFDENHWLDVLAQGEASAHAESYPDALQIRNVVTANELKELAKINLDHDKNRLKFAIKKLDHEHRRSLLKNPVPWAIAASLILGVSLAINTSMQQPVSIAPIAMNEPKEIEIAPPVKESPKTVIVEKIVPLKSQALPENKTREPAQQPPQSRVILADKAPAKSSPENPLVDETQEALLDIPAPPVAAAMPPLNAGSDGLSVPDQPEGCACIPTETDDPNSYFYSVIFSGQPIADADQIETLLKKYHVVVLRSMDETSSNGGPRVVLKFRLPEKLPKEIKSTFKKHHMNIHDNKKINLEVLYVPYK